MTENYNEDSIKSLDWKEHIRLRPGMYIGKLGDGLAYDDGIYMLLKEIVDNAIDEYTMGYGKIIEVELSESIVRVRDYGRGLPFGKVIDCVSKINTGAKYDSKVFKKSVGLNGVGSKVVNALSSLFTVESVREGKKKRVVFEQGKIVSDVIENCPDEKNGTIISFLPDKAIFGNYNYQEEYLEKLILNYVYLNAGLLIYFNGRKFYSEKGLFDLLTNEISETILYPIIHIKEGDFEMAMTHSTTHYGEQYYSFVNGQHTTQGGTHLSVFKEAVVKTIKDFYKKDFESSDIRNSIVAAISIKIQEPVFESQTKTKLGSQYIEDKGASIKSYIGDILKKKLDDYLHSNKETAEVLLNKITQTEKERKEFEDIKKISKVKASKANLHNKKLRDCRVHYNTNHERRFESSLFITEGDSASGSITISRDVATQAVFSLRGKPLNCFGLSKKIIYENEEFNLLLNALNIDNEIEDLRYNNIIIASDADVDGMHIRLLIVSFFLHFYPDVVKNGHLYILQTPLFRIRNKTKTIYSYSEKEKQKAIKELGSTCEITRFKGLGEISPSEFKNFIGKSIRLEPVLISKDTLINNLLSFYMGKNTMDRQNFIIENLQNDFDVAEV